MFSDFDRSKRLGEVSDGYDGGSNSLAKLIKELVYVFLKGLPVGYRLLLRRNIGILTISPISVSMAFLWVYIIFRGGGGWDYVKEWPSFFGYEKGDYFYIPFSYLWYFVSFPAHVLLDIGTEYWDTSTVDKTQKNILYFQGVGLAIALFMLVRGFFILWVSAPLKIRNDEDYNPFSFGISYITIDEYARKEWFGKQRSRLYYERVIEPLGLAMIGVGLMLFKDQIVPNEYISICHATGLYFTMIGASAFFEARKLQRQLLDHKMMQLANKAWFKEMDMEFDDMQVEDFRRYTVQYGGKR